MQIEERRVGEVTILALAGKLTVADGHVLLKERVGALIRGGHKKLLLNLSEVPYVDSAGLGEVVRAYIAVNQQGGKLKLLGVARRIRDLLALTKLLTVLEVFETEQDALDSFYS